VRADRLRVTLVAVALVTAGCSGSGAAPGPSRLPAPPPPAAFTPVETGKLPTSQHVDCPAATVTVTSADALSRALQDARPGTVINLAHGNYAGTFTITRSGTAAAPIWICGTPASMINGDDQTHGYGFHIDHAGYVRLSGFMVTNAQKGVVVDGCTGCLIQDLVVQNIGDEGIHLRAATTATVVRGNTVSHTGTFERMFGEGIYVGTAQSNWCTISGCQPDRSDGNVLRDNVISATGAESIDIKEGTTSGLVVGNTFDGTGMEGADSWVDVKGNGWTIQDNSGRHTPEDGFQTHRILAGWGTGNTFTGNTAEVDGPGYGFHLTPVADNQVTCSNTATNAGKGLANVACR
jgi:nitrous oxidase accessory protein NosD